MKVAARRWGPGRLRGWGEKQEAYFILRRTVMRNGDSRAHYFASTVAKQEKKDLPERRRRRKGWRRRIACLSFFMESISAIFLI